MPEHTKICGLSSTGENDMIFCKWDWISMVFTVTTTIASGRIRLPKRVKIPDGTKVIVTIKPALKADKKRKIISSLCGAWSDDASIIPIFEEIEGGRRIGMQRISATRLPR